MLKSRERSLAAELEKAAAISTVLRLVDTGLRPDRRSYLPVAHRASVKKRWAVFVMKDVEHRDIPASRFVFWCDNRPAHLGTNEQSYVHRAEVIALPCFVSFNVTQ